MAHRTLIQIARAIVFTYTPPEVLDPLHNTYIMPAKRRTVTFCSSCGAQVPDGANFCLNCGSRLSTPVSQGISAQTGLQYPQQPNVAQQVQPSQDSASASQPAYRQYLVTRKIEKGFHIVRDRVVVDHQGNTYLTVHRKSNWKLEYEFVDSGGNGYGQFHINEVGPHHTTTVKDAYGSLLGYVNRKVLAIGHQEWYVEDPAKQRIADAIGDLFGYNYKVISSTGTEVAAIHQDFSAFAALSLSNPHTYVVRLATQAPDERLILALAVAAEELGSRQQPGAAAVNFPF